MLAQSANCVSPLEARGGIGGRPGEAREAGDGQLMEGEVEEEDEDDWRGHHCSLKQNRRRNA